MSILADRSYIQNHQSPKQLAMPYKPLVLVVGATGNTGKIITDALLASDNFVRLGDDIITLLPI